LRADMEEEPCYNSWKQPEFPYI